MGIVSQTNLDVANTSIITAANAIFSGAAPSIYQAFTQTIPAEGESVEIVCVDGVPVLREWIGPKQYYDLRAYKKNVAVRQWEASISLPGTKWRGDKSGVLAQRVADMAANIPSSVEKVVIDALVANTLTGYDGQALLSDSHPNVATGGTSDNLSTTALSFSQLKTAVQSIEETCTENGKFLGLVPNLLVVGTQQKQIGMQVTGSVRPTGVDADSALDGGTAVAAVVIPNYLVGGSIDLLVTPYITGNEWFLFATNLAGVKPWGLAVFRTAVEVPQTDDDHPARFEADEYRWSVEADMSPTPIAWQCAYGSVTA